MVHLKFLLEIFYENLVEIVMYATEIYRYMSAWLLPTIFHFHDFHGIRGGKATLPAILCLDGSIRKHKYLPKNW